MKDINAKIHANVIRKAWKDAPEGRAKVEMLKYAERLSGRA